MNAIDAPATVQSCSQSIREIGEMLQVADRHPNYPERLAELERLVNRADLHVRTLKDLVVAEHLDAMGGV